MEQDITIENAHLILEEFENIPMPKTTSRYVCEDCDVSKLEMDGGLVCPNCGLCDEHEYVYFHDYDNDCQHRQKKTIYKRRQYFEDKLSTFACLKQSRSPKYRSIVKMLKEYEFETIQELKDILKENKLHKFYVHMFNIFHDIKGVKLIDLEHKDIKKLSSKFVEIESQFRNDDDKKRINCYNYNAMLYFLLKQEGYDCYQHIILPQNFSDVEELFQN